MQPGETLNRDTYNYRVPGAGAGGVDHYVPPVYHQSNVGQQEQLYANTYNSRGQGEYVPIYPQVQPQYRGYQPPEQPVVVQGHEYRVSHPMSHSERRIMGCVIMMLFTPIVASITRSPTITYAYVCFSLVMLINAIKRTRIGYHS